jgi:hypothetical protein
MDAKLDIKTESRHLVCLCNVRASVHTISALLEVRLIVLYLLAVIVVLALVTSAELDF